MKFFTKEVKIALVAIAGIVILFFGLNFLKGMSLFSNDNIYYIRFKNISGLSASNPIYADGYQVGVVKGIDYDYQNNGDVVVKFAVDNNLRIPRGSSAEIESDLMGNVKMNLLMSNNPRERVEPGDTLQGEVSAGLMGMVASIIPTLQRTIGKVDSLLDNMNALLANPAIAQSLNNVQTITSDLTTSTRELNQLLAQANGSLPGMIHKANGVLDNTQQLTANLAAVDVQSTMTKVNATLANVQEFTDKLNNNQGSLGLLMNDPGLYNNLNATMSSADSLLIDLRAHPKRYVHFSLFGRKDK
ncbi:MAG: MlaD family protein [Prevotella sp.]|jgi:phospholipid/cholesterol/gamma-HCH transport system substrate-binding protein